MKSTCILFLLLIVSLKVLSQNIVLDPVKDKALIADTAINKINKGINFGVSLGFNRVFGNLHEARISPIDNRLHITSTSRSAFLISTGVSVPLSFRPVEGGIVNKAYKYFKKDNEKIINYIPYGLYLVATVNLVTFSSAGDGSVFNKRIDGGLGFGYRVNDDVQFAVTYEMISYRQPRPFLYDYDGKQITLPAQLAPITALNEDDNNYFRDRYMPSISLKVFYLIRGSSTKAN